MKRITTYLALLLLFSFPSMAQNYSYTKVKPKKKWQLSQVNFGLGVNWNEFESMSHGELMVFAKDPEQMYRDLQNMSEEAIATTAGGSINLSYSLSPLSYKDGTYRKDRELQFGVTLHSAKEAMVSFKNEDLDTSIVFCNLHEELSFEAAYLFKGQWGKSKRWHWYVGGGMNVGFTFGNEMVLMSGQYFEPGSHPSEQVIDEESTEKFEGRAVYYSRVYVPYGIHYRVGEHFLLGLDFRTGIGMQMIGSEKVNFMKRSGALSIGGKYLLN